MPWLFFFGGCNQKPKTPDHLKEIVDLTSLEYASLYICPMHCEGSGSDETGKCPVCKMDYVKNKDLLEEDALETEVDSSAIINEDGSNDEVIDENSAVTIDFTCPIHPEVIGREGETCEICGMDLVEYHFEDAIHTDNH